MQTSWFVLAVLILVILSTLILLATLVFHRYTVANRKILIFIVSSDIIVQLFQLVWYLFDTNLVIDFISHVLYYTMMLLFVVNETQFLQKLTAVSDISPATIATIKTVFFTVFPLLMLPFLADAVWVLIRGTEDPLLLKIRNICVLCWDGIVIIYEIWQAVFVYVILSRYIRTKYHNTTEELTEEKAMSLKALGRLQMLSMSVVGVDLTCVCLIGIAYALQRQNASLSEDINKLSFTLGHFHVFAIVFMFATIKQAAFPSTSSQKSSKNTHPKRLSKSKHSDLPKGPMTTVLL